MATVAWKTIFVIKWNIIYNHCGNIPDCKVCHWSRQGALVPYKICTKTHQWGKKIGPLREKSPKKTITVKLQTKKGWGCTLVRHFWLPLVKIRVVIGCRTTYKPPSNVGICTARTKFHHSHRDYVKICTDSAPAGRLTSHTDKILSKMPWFTVWEILMKKTNGKQAKKKVKN